MLRFCPNCGNILFVIEKFGRNHIGCRVCFYNHPVQKNIKEVTYFENKARKQYVYTEADRNRGSQSTQANCPSCDNTRAYFIQVQTRSADEAMTIFYRCTKCEHNWKEN